MSAAGCGSRSSRGYDCCIGIRAALLLWDRLGSLGGIGRVSFRSLSFGFGSHLCRVVREEEQPSDSLAQQLLAVKDLLRNRRGSGILRQGLFLGDGLAILLLGGLALPPLRASPSPGRFELGFESLLCGRCNGINGRDRALLGNNGFGNGVLLRLFLLLALLGRLVGKGACVACSGRRSRGSGAGIACSCRLFLGRPRSFRFFLGRHLCDLLLLFLQLFYPRLVHMRLLLLLRSRSSRN
mmetsp:Transcript_72277/g.156934  ORF Transcript_72277/g.156934 Transcript_72277/m.156934 type:complete len:239 (+) Transcript_72277:2167-2883(+)